MKRRAYHAFWLVIASYAYHGHIKLPYLVSPYPRTGQKFDFPFCSIVVFSIPLTIAPMGHTLVWMDFSGSLFAFGYAHKITECVIVIVQ